MYYLYTPHVLKIIHFMHESLSSSNIRNVMDYEFDFCVGCDREMWLDDNHYKIGKGCFIIRKPGQRVRSKGYFDCYQLTLDFSNCSNSYNYSRNSATKMQQQFESKIWSILPSVFYPVHYEDYVRIFKELVSINEIDINDNPKTISLINELLHLIIADAYLCFRPNESRIKSEIDEVFSYIKNNFTEDISLDDISAVAHMNKNYLVRKFKNNYGISPISYLIKLRMDYAKKLLAESDIPIKVIAASCGYSDPSFFNSYFKKTFHITPAAYRQLHQESNKHIEY